MATKVKEEFKLDPKIGADMFGPSNLDPQCRFMIYFRANNKPFQIYQCPDVWTPTEKVELKESDELIKPSMTDPAGVRTTIVNMFKSKSKLAFFKKETINRRHLQFFIIHEMGAFKLLAIAFKDKQMVFSKAKIKF